MAQNEVILKVKTDTTDANDGLEQVKKNTKDTGDAAKEAAGNFSIMGVSLNGVKAAFGKIIPMAKAMFGSIKAGLISTGIGAFVIAIGSLISYFTNTKKGAEQLQRIFKGFGAAVAVLTDRFSAVGETIVNAFSNPKEAIIGLWNTIKENLINRIEGTIDQFKAFGKIIKSAIDLDFDGVKEGAEDFASATLQVATGMDEVQRKNFANTVKEITTEIKNETNAAIELAGALQKIKDAEREFSIQKAKTAQEIQKARFEALDENKTLEERLEALQRAADLEIETTNKAIQLQKEKLAARQAEVDLGESLEEDYDDLAALEVELINLQTQSFQTRKRIATEIETLTREQAALDAEAAKEKEEREKEIADLRKSISLELMSEQEQEIFKATEKYDKLIELAEQFGLDTEDIERKKEEKLKEIRDGFREKEKNSVSEQMQNTLDIAAQMASSISNITKQREANELQEIENKFAGELKAAEGNADLTADIERRKQTEVEAVKKEFAGAKKKGAVAEALINTFQSATKSLADYGFPVGAVFAALAITQGMLQVKNIQNTPAFAQGGMVGGYGTSTSDSVSARLSKGESVINARSTRMFKPLLSAINEAGGGRSFASGEGVGGSTMGVVKAFVVADDMTKQQDKMSKIRRKATI